MHTGIKLDLDALHDSPSLSVVHRSSKHAIKFSCSLSKWESESSLGCHRVADGSGGVAQFTKFDALPHPLIPERKASVDAQSSLELHLHSHILKRSMFSLASSY